MKPFRAANAFVASVAVLLAVSGGASAAVKPALSDFLGGAAAKAACAPTLADGLVAGSVADPDDCTRFFLCTKWFQTRLVCPEGQHFSAEKQECVEACEAGCDPALECPAESADDADDANNVDKAGNADDADKADDADDANNVDNGDAASAESSAADDMTKQDDAPESSEMPADDAASGKESMENASSAEHESTSDDVPAAGENAMDPSDDVSDDMLMAPAKFGASTTADAPAADAVDDGSDDQDGKEAVASQTDMFDWKSFVGSYGKPSSEAPADEPAEA